MFNEPEPPEDALQVMIRSMLERASDGAQTPPALQALPRDLSSVLGENESPSFTTPLFDNRSRRVVALRRMDTAPPNLPTVAQNVVVHEFGHATGLGHNADASLLMCGRPAPFRPPDSASTQLRIFALSAEELRHFAVMYPVALPPRRP